ncbi:sulfatase-like hydrolase/transferase [Prosthecobacter sp.]|uniref:sulfatase family protein n=1 Tax=Prosthecobacter sp. TaxID=1965333 RepID=UPI001D29ACA2|nr:sulfatase-like hydrolase/transferase [Prosthecobacter sp.]MCB1278667.1 sulfatase-like hydrolase/transferase [Prosthecobacter sp.]
MHRIFIALLLLTSSALATKPNIIFVMADDMGWGQTGYRGHPVLKTPNIDAMAANGLRLDRFYAGCPVCSPTRASVLTGRSPDRAGVLSHGYALRLQEKTISQALKAAGYVTGHFGKWHLDGFKGPGAPILKDDPRSPGAFAFDEWTSVTNFYDQNPLMSREGEFVDFKGDSSDVVVDEALKFIEKHHSGDKPLFTVIWYGTPHAPFKALEADKAEFGALDKSSQDHYGELVALDRSLGKLRQKLRDFGIADNTLLVFNSDNGGLPGIKPETVGGLRGFKGSVFEGGLRVPGIIEWPSVIKPRVTNHAACTMDLFPTVADVLGLSDDVIVKPVDGVSLKPLFAGEIGDRKQAIPFRFGTKAALTGQRYKILTENLGKGEFQFYDLETDPNETKDISKEQPEMFEKMKKDLLAWNASVDASFAGKDYPEGKVTPPDPESIPWTEFPGYKPFLEEWSKRWEYESAIKGATKGGKKKKNKSE